MIVLFGLAWLWWGLIGLAGFLLGFWGVCQLSADDRYLAGLKDGTANIKGRDAWLRYFFGEKGRKLWLSNEARRKDNWLDKARRVPGSPDVYEGTVNDWDRDTKQYAYSPPWGFDNNPRDPDHYTWPREYDWLAAGFWAPFEFNGCHIDPIQQIKGEMLDSWQRHGRARSPFDDKGEMDKWARQKALEIEANGGVRARGISQYLGADDHFDPLGRAK